jgi:hypothetical protein
MALRDPSRETASAVIQMFAGDLALIEDDPIARSRQTLPHPVGVAKREARAMRVKHSHWQARRFLGRVVDWIGPHASESVPIGKRINPAPNAQMSVRAIAGVVMVGEATKRGPLRFSLLARRAMRERWTLDQFEDERLHATRLFESANRGRSPRTVMRPVHDRLFMRRFERFGDLARDRQMQSPLSGPTDSSLDKQVQSRHAPSSKPLE